MQPDVNLLVSFTKSAFMVTFRDTQGKKRSRVFPLEVNLRSNMYIEQEPKCTIYLDYAATTPVDPQVAEVMAQYLGINGIFGNAASRSHCFGWKAKEAVERAREHVASLINADPSEIVWTSGATESINLAIKGVAHGHTGQGKHIVTSSLEHKAVLDSCAQLAREGFEITYVDPDQDGLISPEHVKQALRDDTILVSLMHVNNEIGTITDIAAIGEITRARGITLHVDAAQSTARLPLDTRSIQADLISLSGHKMYGPKGVGALYVHRRLLRQIEPQMHGGGQEQGIRSGTLATHQLVGMGEAARLMGKHLSQDIKTATTLDYRLLNRLADIEFAFVNGNQAHRVPGIVNMAFACVENESLMMSTREVAIASGSACTSARVEPSHVLQALGLPENLASCSVRFSLGRFTTTKDIDLAVAYVRQSVDALRLLSPEWQLYQRNDSVPQHHYHAKQAVTA